MAGFQASSAIRECSPRARVVHAAHRHVRERQGAGAPCAARRDRWPPGRLPAIGRWLRLALGLWIAFACGAVSAADPDFRILSPAQDETVLDNTGTVQVRLEIPASLAGSRIVLLLDGKEVAADLASAFTLEGVERGRHTLVARALPPGASVAVESPPIDFDMFQASALFPSRN